MQKNLWISVFILCFASVIPFLALAFFNHPSADDYLGAIPAMESGPIKATIGWYFGWSARYTSAFLTSVNPMVWGSLVGYQFTSWLLIGALFFAFSLWFRITGEEISVWKSTVLGLLGLGVYIGSVPSVVEGFYYINGAICYQPANAFLLVLTSWWFAGIPMEKISIGRYSLLFLGIQCLLIVLIGGTNEMAMAFSLALTGGLFLYWMIFKKKWHPGIFMLFLSSVFSALLVIFSPATVNRMRSSNSLKRDLGDVLNMVMNGYLDFVSTSVSNPVLPAFGILIVWMPVSQKVPVLNRTSLLLLSFFSFLLSVFCFVPSYLGEGMIQDRTANGLLFNILLLFMINAVLWKRNLQTKEGQVGSGLSPMALWLMLGTSLLIFLTSNFRNAFSDLTTGEANAYHREQLARIEKVKSSPGDSVWVDPLRHHPRTLFFSDIGKYPQPWYDGFYARYHGKKFIFLTHP